MMKEMYDKVDRWTRAILIVKNAEHSLKVAKHELNGAVDNLGKSMIPEDHSNISTLIKQIAENETFNLWVRESNLSTAKEGLLSVKYHKGTGAFTIFWRQKPK